MVVPLICIGRRLDSGSEYHNRFVDGDWDARSAMAQSVRVTFAMLLLAVADADVW